MSNNKLKKNEPFLDLEPIYTNSDGGYGDAYGYAGGQMVENTERRQLMKIFSVLRKYWLMIASFAIIITSLVVVYEARKPDYYKAEVRIQVDNEVNPAAGGKGGAVILNQGTDPAYFTTQLQILEGSGLIRRVVKTLDLEHNEEFFRPGKTQGSSTWENVKRMFGQASPVVKTTKQDMSDVKIATVAETNEQLDRQAETLAPYVGFIKGGLNVDPVNDSRTASKITRLIEIEYTHFDPDMASKVANTIADVYVLQNLELKTESNSSASDFLQKRVAELQTKIRLGEERLINYAKSNQILSLDASQNTVVQRLSDLNNRLSQAENERISAEASYRAALKNPQFDQLSEDKDARTQALETQRQQLQQQLTQLKTQYTDEWPEVKTVKQQIAAIEVELQKRRKTANVNELSGLEQTFRQAASREAELRKNFEQQRSAVLDQNEAAINYRIIQQEIDTNKSLLDSLLQRSRETDIVLNGTTNNVYVLDRALTPRSPAGPNRTKNVIVAFFASTLAGIGFAFLLTWLDDKIRPDENLEALLGLPVIGMIPRSVSSSSVRRLLLGRFGRRPQVAKYDIGSFEKPIVTEAFHQLRTSILFSTAGGEPKTILVTSGQPAEGKTINSFNLARSLAQLGNKVLLIDADMRCPKMHSICNVGNEMGLSNLLIMKELTQKAIADAVHPDVEGNMDLLTSGPTSPNPTNLLSSNEMKLLLQQLSAIYTHIIIDSPPVLYFADSVILATKVDAVVLIARSNISRQEVVLQTRRKLQDVRANVVGIVLNDIFLNDYQYSSYHYYKEFEEVSEPGDAIALNLHQ